MCQGDLEPDLERSSISVVGKRFRELDGGDSRIGRTTFDDTRGVAVRAVLGRASRFYVCRSVPRSRSLISPRRPIRTDGFGSWRLFVAVCANGGTADGRRRRTFTGFDATSSFMADDTPGIWASQRCGGS